MSMNFGEGLLYMMTGTTLRYLDVGCSHIDIVALPLAVTWLSLRGHGGPFELVPISREIGISWCRLE